MVPTDFAIVGTLKAALLMKFGAELLHGTVRFRLWAPKIEEVLVLLNGGPPLSMNRTADGWHELVCSDCPAGTRYKFRLERDGPQVPDPASRCQPEDVHGPSEVIDPHQYVWLDRGWRGAKRGKRRGNGIARHAFPEFARLRLFPRRANCLLAVGGSGIIVVGAWADVARARRIRGIRAIPHVGT
jgi:hypothetical protein